MATKRERVFGRGWFIRQVAFEIWSHSGPAFQLMNHPTWARELRNIPR